MSDDPILDLARREKEMMDARRRGGPPPRPLPEATTERERIIAERATVSLADFMEHGPRFWVGRKAWVVAKGDDDMVLLGGVGTFGIGRMWIADDMASRQDPTYPDAPYEPDTPDDFGVRGRRHG